MEYQSGRKIKILSMKIGKKKREKISIYSKCFTFESLICIYGQRKLSKTYIAIACSFRNIPFFFLPNRCKHSFRARLLKAIGILLPTIDLLHILIRIILASSLANNVFLSYKFYNQNFFFS